MKSLIIAVLAKPKSRFFKLFGYAFASLIAVGCHRASSENEHVTSIDPPPVLSENVTLQESEGSAVFTENLHEIHETADLEGAAVLESTQESRFESSIKESRLEGPATQNHSVDEEASKSVANEEILQSSQDVSHAEPSQDQPLQQEKKSLEVPSFVKEICLEEHAIENQSSEEHAIDPNLAVGDTSSQECPVQAVARFPVFNGIVLLEKDEEVDSSVCGIQIHLAVTDRFQKNLQRELAGYLNQEITEERIKEIKKTVSDFYQSKNRPFVTVSTPEQKIKNGVIKVVIKESKLEDFTVKGNYYFKQKRLRKYFHIHRQDPINVAQLEKEVSSVNRNPFRNASLIFKPGETADTTDLELWVLDKRTYRVYAGADNTGIKATGDYRFFVGLNLGNVWGLDHLFSYQFTSSFDTARFYSHTATYTAPVFYNHFITVYGGYSHIKPKMSIENLKHDGKGGQASLRYIVPISPIGKYTHELDFGFDYKITNVNMSYFGEPIVRNIVNISQFMAKYEGQCNFSAAKIPVSLEVYYSPGQMLPHQSNADFSALRYRAMNCYIYSVFTLSPTFPLPKEMELFFNLRSQFSNRNLISTEQFGLGGFYSVRGYAENEVYRDNAILTNLEWRSPRYHLFKRWKDHFQFLVFVDAGTGWDVHPTPNLKNLQYLIGVGPGVRYNLSNHLVLRFDWGFKLHRTDLEPDAKPQKIHFSLIGSF